MSLSPKRKEEEEEEEEEEEAQRRGTTTTETTWKNPSAAHMQKYGLSPLPEDGTFVPTDEERALLDLYESVRGLERQAARLKEEAARAKLAAADAAFQERNAPVVGRKQKRRKKKKTKAAAAAAAADDDDDEEEDLEDEGSEGSVEEDEEEGVDDAAASQSVRERREAKLAALREELEEAKKRQREGEESREDALRRELLQEAAESEDLLEGPSLKRKRKFESSEGPPPASSLIANLTGGATPPHDFSKDLGLTPIKGKVLFPSSTAPDESKWTPPEGASGPNDGAFTAELDGFDVSRAQYGQGNNTVAIKFMAPSDSKRFSINIAIADRHNDMDSILFHFNPRHYERGGQLVINDKQSGIWGQTIAIPLSQVPLIFGQTSCTLMIQITGDGFDVFLEEKHIARLEHRTELPPSTSNLVLQFPSTDDYGSPENWAVYKVWWGNRDVMASGDVSAVAGVNSYNALHPRKLFVSGLTKIYSEPEVDLRRAELERAFRKYGGDRGVHVIVPTHSTYAFVEMESERQCDLALSEMAGQYRLNRARRSKHEALQEERAAAEASKKGGAAAAAISGTKKETGDWD